MQLMHIPFERNMRTFLKTFLPLPFILVTAQKILVRFTSTNSNLQTSALVSFLKLTTS